MGRVLHSLACTIIRRIGSHQFEVDEFPEVGVKSRGTRVGSGANFTDGGPRMPREVTQDRHPRGRCTESTYRRRNLRMQGGSVESRHALIMPCCAFHDTTIQLKWMVEGSVIPEGRVDMHDPARPSPMNEVGCGVWVASHPS